MRNVLADVFRFRAAIAGVAIIGVLLAVSVYVVVAIPYREAIRLWQGGEALWLESPRNAWPVWVN